MTFTGMIPGHTAFGHRVFCCGRKEEYTMAELKYILYHNKRYQVTAIRQYASKLCPDHILWPGHLRSMEG